MDGVKHDADNSEINKQYDDKEYRERRLVISQDECVLGDHKARCLTSMAESLLNLEELSKD